MSYAVYHVAGRLRGYAVACTCHQRGCTERINRGLAYLCYCCSWYFCPAHLTVAGDQEYIKVDCFAGESARVCRRCAAHLERDARRGRVPSACHD